MERAFDAILTAVKEENARLDFVNNEGLEAFLRRELVDIARSNGVSDPETLQDILLARLPTIRPAPPTD
jgi:hypothetical protein